MRHLEGKVALVTGGGKGIGRSIALALAAGGARLIITGRDERALGETVGEIAYGGGKARHLAGDVRDPAHLEAAVARAHEVFGSLDIVVAGAGQAGRVAVGHELARAESILSTNLMGAYGTFHAAIPRMASPGRLIALSRAPAGAGGAGGSGGSGGCGAFAASQAGLVALVREAAAEVASRKITCNALLVGGSDTLEPEEVAAVAVFLCSPAADHLTGQALTIGGIPPHLTDVEEA